jgi:hypothetical protein
VPTDQQNHGDFCLFFVLYYNVKKHYYPPRFGCCVSGFGLKIAAQGQVKGGVGTAPVNIFRSVQGGSQAPVGDGLLTNGKNFPLKGRK